MKFNSYWIYFTLLAAAQLSLVLAGVAFLFQWYETAETDAVRATTLSNTRASAAQIADRLRVFRTSDQFQKQLSTSGLANGGIACILDAKTGETISQHGELTNASGEAIGELPFVPQAARPCPTTTILAAFTAPSKPASVSGSLRIGESTWWGTAHRLTNQHGIVFVAQPQSSVMQDGSNWFHDARASSLATAFLLSFFAIVLPIIALFYYDNNLRTINNKLERQATYNERELVRTRNAVIFGLAKLAESRDNDTGEHLDRIRKYVEILSNDLASQFEGIDDEFTRDLSLASSLHDIGKVGIPDSILLKPGRLTPEERNVMQIHTVIGGECLDAIGARLGDNPFMHMARQIAYYHHERWDGQGYPHQLSADEIPLVARIVAVADVYDALTSKRPYKRAMSHLESRAIVLAGSGSQFDPEIVAAFMRHEHEFEEISRKQQSVSDAEATSRFVRLHELAAAGAEEVS